MQRIIKLSADSIQIKAFSFIVLLPNLIILSLFLFGFFYIKIYEIFIKLDSWPKIILWLLIFLFIYYLLIFDFIININKNLKIDDTNLYIKKFTCLRSDILGVCVTGGAGNGRGSNATYRVFIEIKTNSFFRKKKWIISAPSEEKALEFALTIANFLNVRAYNKRNELYTG